MKLILLFLLSISSFAQEQKSSWSQKLFFNGAVGLSLGNVTQVQLSPGLGYQFSKKFGAGLGLSYLYSSDDRFTPTLKQSVWGPRAFAIYKIFNPIYLKSRYEFLNYKNTSGNSQFSDNEHSLFLGGGYRLGEGRVSLGIEFLYDLLHDDESLRSEAYIVQVGVSVGF